MTQLMTSRLVREVEARLRKLAHPVSLLYFARSGECGTCAAQQALLEEVTALSEKLALEVFDLDADSGQALRYGIEKVPATAVLGYRDYGIRFYGLTAGYQFAPLLESIVMAAGDRSGLAQEIEAAVQSIRRPLHLEILVSLRCPYSGSLVGRAHQLAIANRNILADMVNAVEFPRLVESYRADRVPLIVINGHPAPAAEPSAITNAVMRVLHALDPETSAAAAQCCTCRAADQTEEWKSPQLLTGRLGLEPVSPPRIPRKATADAGVISA